MSKKKKHDETPEPPSLFDNLDLFTTQKKEEPSGAEPADELPGIELPPVAESVEAVPMPPSDDGNHPGGSGPLRDVIDENFLQFASYSICNRAIPTVEDGLKPVQRRILHTLNEMYDGSTIKVATVVGRVMAYHPHGDASIADALVNLEQKGKLEAPASEGSAGSRKRGRRGGGDDDDEESEGYLIRGQGNFGDILTGAPAAASRYIECCLTDLAREELFNKKTTTFVPSYDGRNKEPVLLPAKIPLLLMIGATGIAVGLSTDIMSHNFIELLEAQIAILQKKPFQLFPDFVTGGLLDPSEYNDGLGKFRMRAVIETRDKNKVVIRELPFGETSESLAASIEDAVKKKKLKIKRVDDFTAKNVEIELTLAADTTQEKTIQALYAFTNCEKSITCHPVVLYQNRPREMSVSDILRANTERLQDLLRSELEIRAAELDALFHDKTLEQIFIEERVYKKIEEKTTEEAVVQAVFDGLAPFRSRLRRDVTKEDVDKLLQIRIRRISRYDINKNRQEIEGILKEEAEVAANLEGLRAYTIKYLKGLVKKYKDKYPRRTKIVGPFKQVEVRALTASELTIRWDKENYYLGSGLRNGDEVFKCSSLDKLILVWADGRYKMMPPGEKIFVDKNLLYCAIFDKERQYTCAYVEPHYGFTYIKRFQFSGCIQNKDYRLAPERSRMILFEEGTPAAVYVKYKPMKNQRINQQLFTPSEVLLKGVGAKGIQMTTKGIARIAVKKPSWWDDTDTSPKGLLSS